MKLLRFWGFISPSPKSNHLALIYGKAISIFRIVQIVGSAFPNNRFINSVTGIPILTQNSGTDRASTSAICLIRPFIPPFRISQKTNGKWILSILSASLNNGAISEGECPDIPQPISVTKKYIPGVVSHIPENHQCIFEILHIPGRYCIGLPLCSCCLSHNGPEFHSRGCGVSVMYTTRIWTEHEYFILFQFRNVVRGNSFIHILKFWV